MNEAKTKPTDVSVESVLAGVVDPVRQADCPKVAAMTARATGAPPCMWGRSIVGFGRYEALMARLGKFKTGKACLHIKRLADVDEAVLKELIDASVAEKAPKRVDQ